METASRLAVFSYERLVCRFRYSCLRYARQRFPGWLKGIDKWGIMEKINE
jgi:hypothetical protein